LALQVYSRARRFAEGSGLPTAEKHASIDALDEFSAKADAIRQELKSLQSWFERPKPKVDISRFEARKEPKESAEYESSEIIEARIRATGDF